MDCTFHTENGVFNFRVGAIIKNGNKILMAKNPDDDFYYSVGGRVKLNETLEDAVLREVYEETGIYSEIDRMGFIHENFFYNSEKEIMHEISVFFYIKLSDDLKNIQNGHKTKDGPIGEYLEWIDVTEKLPFNIFPEFFAKKLGNINIEHIVTNNL